MYICIGCAAERTIDPFFLRVAPRAEGSCEFCGMVTICLDIDYKHITSGGVPQEQIDVLKVVYLLPPGDTVTLPVSLVIDHAAKRGSSVTAWLDKLEESWTTADGTKLLQCTRHESTVTFQKGPLKKS